MVERFNFSEYFDIRTFNKHRKYLYVNIDRREELENWEKIIYKLT